jgi:hypothetical protein
MPALNNDMTDEEWEQFLQEWAKLARQSHNDLDKYGVSPPPSREHDNARAK